MNLMSISKKLIYLKYTMYYFLNFLFEGPALKVGEFSMFWWLLFLLLFDVPLLILNKEESWKKDPVLESISSSLSSSLRSTALSSSLPRCLQQDHQYNLVIFVHHQFIVDQLIIISNHNYYILIKISQARLLDSQVCKIQTPSSLSITSSLSINSLLTLIIAAATIGSDFYFGHFLFNVQIILKCYLY